MPALRAVLFDIGGVLTTSPVVAIRRFAERTGVDYRILGPMINDPALAWSRWERSELSEADFVAAFEAEGREQGISVRARDLLDAAFNNHGVRDEIIEVVRHLRGQVRLGAITNNVLRENTGPMARPALHDLFEVVVESAKVGFRKPDPRIFHLACDALEVTPPEAAFLDDIGANLKGARALGMTTIRVDETLRAIDELEAALGIPLPRPNGSTPAA